MQGTNFNLLATMTSIAIRLSTGLALSKEENEEVSMIAVRDALNDFPAFDDYYTHAEKKYNEVNELRKRYNFKICEEVSRRKRQLFLRNYWFDS